MKRKKIKLYSTPSRMLNITIFFHKVNRILSTFNVLLFYDLFNVLLSHSICYTYKPIVDLKKIDPLPIDPTPAIPPRDDIQQPLEVERRYRQIVEEGRKQKEMEERSGIGGILLK